MKDIWCIRCGAKLGWQYEGANGVVIKCPCGAKNYVTNDKSSEKSAPKLFTRPTPPA